MIKETPPSSARKFQRAMHRFRVLDLIRTTGLISRIEIARQTGLSQATITGITAEFIEEGLIEEKQTGEYKGGRRPILLAIKPDGVHVVGINLTIDQIRIVIINFEAEIKASHIFPLQKKSYSPEDLIEIISQQLQECIWEANFSKDRIIGVGIGLPGPVDFESGIVRFLPNYDWKDIPFRKMLQERINHPVFLDNSSNNLTIAEYWYGNGKGIRDFFVITIENGVGAGIIINGQLIRGNDGIASEFGHISINPNGPQCRCGRKGCIEAYVGNTSIFREAIKLHAKGSWNSSLDNFESITISDVIKELQTGNNHLSEVYRQAGSILGQGIFNLIALLNPQRIIITGKGVIAGDYLFASMHQALNKLKPGKIQFPDTQIIIQDWDDGDWAKGAGTLVLREIFKSPSAEHLSPGN